MEPVVLEELQNAVDTIIDVSSSYPCSFCKKSFSTKNNLYRHQRSLHKVQPKTKNKGCLRCPEGNCLYLSRLQSDLRSHLRAIHGIQLEEMKLTFPSMNEFSKWREEEERSSKSMFIATTSMKKLRDGSSKMFLNCHRSGSYRSRGSGKRKLKVQGSCKINRCCPASMKVENQLDKVIVHYCKTHCGHSSDVGDMTHLRLTESERALIAGKLAQGVTFEHILDDLQSSNIKHFNRFHLLKRKDLYNIQRNFKLQHKPAAKEPDTLKRWLEESLAQGGQSPVLYCKDRGSCYDDYHMMEDDLEADDFLLVLSNPLQRDMMIQFGSKVICVDCVNINASHELSLTSVVVLDEFEEPFPVAFCLSNRTDFLAFKRFFEALKDRVGSIVASILMSDDSPALYGAWGQVMGEYEHHLLCPWYTEKCWKNLMEKIPRAKKSERLTVTNFLKTLKEMSDVERFNEELALFLKEMTEDQDCEAFALQFKNQFALRPEMWAHCYLGPKWITIANHLETMHHALRSAFCQGRDFDHIVRCITSLSRLVRDRNCNRLAKAFNDRENMQDRDDDTGVVLEVIEEGNLWQMQSGCEEPVQVRRVSGFCIMSNCHKSTCPHVYTCSCIDYVAFSKCCQHIETVVQLVQCQTPQIPSCPLQVIESKKPLTSRVEEKVEMLLGFLKKGKFTDAMLEQIENQIDEWLNDTKSGSHSLTHCVNDRKSIEMVNEETTVNSDRNMVLLICPPSMNVKVPISRYKSPLDKANSIKESYRVHSGFDHVY